MLAWTVFAATCAAAIGLCLIATAPAAAPRADADLRRAAYDEIASHERAMREESAHEFPADPWSQDDAFHEKERRRAVSFAHRKRVRVEDVLDAVDEGLRAHPERLVATVPPCRPRAIY